MKRWGALGLAVVAIMGTNVGGAAAAADRGLWRLNETGSPTTALDSSGLGNNGTNSNIVATGSGYRFNGTSSRVVIPDKDSLDPGTADFSYGVTLVMDTAPPRGETYDVLRKGVTTSTGGEYKLEIEHVNGKANAHCVVKDAQKVVASIVAPTNLANGSPHTITCSKTSRGVSVKIDSLAPRVKTVKALGSVSNTSNLALGAKAEPKPNSGFDWYRGLLRDAWVSVPETAAAGDDAVVASTATDRGVWQLYEKGSPTTALDSSGFGNNGTNSNIVATGNGYTFNGTSSRVVIPDKDSLDPGTANFSFGVTVVMSTPPVRGETYDVLRKGVTTSTGGEYKLEIEHVSGKAYARCLVKDAKKVVASIVAPTNLADGSPHAITCSKTSRGVSVKIDALAPRSKTVAALGSVSNTARLGLGAKAEAKTNSGFDWYLGLMRDAWVRVG